MAIRTDTRFKLIFLCGFLFIFFVNIQLINCGNERSKYIEEEEERINFDSLTNKPKDNKVNVPKVEVLTYYRPPWFHYKFELTILFIIILYIINFYFSLRSSRILLVNWLKNNYETLSNYYSVVGSVKDNDAIELNRFSTLGANRYALWCTGDEFSRGLMFEFELLPRSDLAFGIWSRINMQPDTVEITMILNPNLYERFNFFIGRKSFWQKSKNGLTQAKTLCRDYSDLKPQEYSESTVVMSESQAIVRFFFESELSREILKLYSYFNYIFITDVSDHVSVIDSSSGKEETIKSNILMTISMQLTKSSDLWFIQPLDNKSIISSFLSVMRKMMSIRLSRETKQIIEKSRIKLNEEKFKADHTQRQEAAILKKEEKMKLLKKKILEETDPEKQIKLKEQLEKKENKQKQRKMNKGKSVRLMM